MWKPSLTTLNYHEELEKGSFFGLSILFVQLLGTDFWERNQTCNLLREMGGCIAIKWFVGSLEKSRKDLILDGL